jgi:hypothetical protein
MSAQGELHRPVMGSPFYESTVTPFVYLVDNFGDAMQIPVGSPLAYQCVERTLECMHEEH